MPENDLQTDETGGTGEGTETVENQTEKVIDDKSLSDIDKADNKGALSNEDQAKINTLQSLLDDHDIESPEDLKTFVANLATLKDNLGTADLAELKANSALLRRYQKQWEKQEAQKLEENETPEETIARLKKENKAKDEKQRAEAEARKEAQENQKLLNSFNKSVKKIVKSQTDLPESYQNILTEFLGVDNEINEIDLEDTASIKRIAKAASKKIMAFEQDVIKRYLAGKAKVVKMTSTDETPAAPEKKVKNLKDARGIMKERLGKIFGK